MSHADIYNTPQTAAFVASAVSVAQVAAAESGGATRVIEVASGAEYAVLGHFDSAPSLHCGDMVCVLIAATGAIIAGRLRGMDEAPAATFRESGGRLEVSAERSIAIRVGRSCIELGADGVVRVDGLEIHQLAERRLSLLAATVEVN